MSLDLKALYPNLHAETTRHASSSPRPTSGKGTNRKKLELEPPRSPSRQAATVSGRLPLATQRTGRQPQQRVLPSTIKPSAKAANHAQSHGGEPGSRSSRSMPPLSGSSCASRPTTPAASASIVDLPPELSFVGSQRTKQQPQNPFESPEDSSPASDLRYLGKTRSHVLRGDLPVDAATPASTEKVPLRAGAGRGPPRLVHSLSMSNALPLQELIQCSSRPRSRYARREITTPIQPLHTNRLSQSASTPTLSRVNDHDVVDNRPSSSSSMALTVTTERLALRGSSQPSDGQRGARGRKALPQPPILSWTEQDASSFFLTEIDAKDAADQWTIARALARGAHLLYAKREFERAVACFADALTIAQHHQEQHQEQDQQNEVTAATPLLSLLHHHMGVAFNEDGQAKWALMMQKKALELAQRCGDLKLQARALKALGVLFLDRHEPQKALDCQQQALSMALDAGDAELEARVYANLGNLAAAQHQFLHAIACHERDLAACSATQLDSAVGQARAHRNLALVYAKMGGHQDAQLDHELHAARLEAANTFETDMRRHANDAVGNIYLQLSKPDEALAGMVATSVMEVLTAREDDESGSYKQQQENDARSPETYMI